MGVYDAGYIWGEWGKFQAKEMAGFFSLFDSDLFCPSSTPLHSCSVQWPHDRQVVCEICKKTCNSQTHLKSHKTLAHCESVEAVCDCERMTNCSPQCTLIYCLLNLDWYKIGVEFIEYIDLVCLYPASCNEYLSWQKLNCKTSMKLAAKLPRFLLVY